MSWETAGRRIHASCSESESSVSKPGSDLSWLLAAVIFDAVLDGFCFAGRFGGDVVLVLGEDTDKFDGGSWCALTVIAWTEVLF